MPVSANDIPVTIPDEEIPALLEPLHAIQLPDEVIMESTARSEMLKADCNAIVFDMRTEDGCLHYVSDLTLAIDSGASAALPGLNDAIRNMNATADLYTIARVSCFPDSQLTETKPELCLHRDSGAVWKDSAQTAWLSPQRDEVQSYLFDICQELSDLGFDEILLTNCAYPTKGTTELAGTSGDTIDVFSVTLSDFYKEMRSRLEADGVRLSILWEPSPENDQNKPTSGQTLDEALFAADRVWMQEDDYEKAVDVFSSQGLSYSNFSFVRILSKPGKSVFSWAVL
jgi:hypothetical protein